MLKWIDFSYKSKCLYKGKEISLPFEARGYWNRRNGSPAWEIAIDSVVFSEYKVPREGTEKEVADYLKSSTEWNLSIHNEEWSECLGKFSVPYYTHPIYGVWGAKPQLRPLTRGYFRRATEEEFMKEWELRYGKYLVPIQKEETSVEFKVGDIVSHLKFGQGTISSVMATSYYVKFAEPYYSKIVPKDSVS